MTEAEMSANGTAAVDGAAAVSATGGQVDAGEAARRSQKECRVYVGNLSYDVKADHLKEFMTDGGWGGGSMVQARDLDGLTER